MFFKSRGFRMTNSFHSRLLILPSLSASASANVLLIISARFSSESLMPDSNNMVVSICWTSSFSIYPVCLKSYNLNATAENQRERD
uniref:Calcineurin B-like protein 6 n=1 Tax=Rhizophora mucronata TaxID=61149 RepID=A0A2P2KG60_RHIMU